MKANMRRLGGVGLFFLVMGVASPSFAASVQGKVTFVGTLSELNSSGLHARFRVRVSGSTCDGGTVRDRWIEIRSGRMDTGFEHNQANARNAYSTLQAAFLSGKTIQIDSSSISCSSTASQIINLWSSNVGIY